MKTSNIMSDRNVNLIVNEIMSKGSLNKLSGYSHFRNISNISNHGLPTFILTQIPGSESFSNGQRSYYGIPMSVPRNELKTMVRNWYTWG